MKTAEARAAKRADQPPSTPGTSAGRTRLRPLAVGALIIGIIAVAAQVVAADPASAPVQSSAVDVVTSIPAAPARPVRAADAPERDAFEGLGDVTVISAAMTSGAGSALDPTPPPPPPPPPTTTTTTAPPPPPPPPPAPVAAPQPSSGRCGGDLPPCYVMDRESGGSLTAQNPSSTASGKWQFLDSTWAGYGGYASAYQAPESVQDAKARELWAGGAGCGHWSAC